MLVDLRSVAKRLAEGAAEAEAAAEGGDSDAHGGSSTAFGAADTGRSIMVVESDVQMQDIFRKSFKQAGYRVLVTADPARATGRFRQDATVADCIVFSAQQIGPPAMEMFNELGEDERTESVPAILLLDERQQQWQSKARTAGHRIVLTTPITMGQLRTSLEQLLPAAAKTKAVHGTRGRLTLPDVHSIIPVTHRRCAMTRPAHITTARRFWNGQRQGTVRHRFRV